MGKTSAQSRLDLAVLVYTGNIPRLMDGYDAMKGPPDIPYNGSANLSKYNLTDREKEVLNCVAIGRSNKEIASFLGKSESTIRHYVITIMQKTHAESRLELAVLVYTGNIPRVMEEYNKNKAKDTLALT